MFSSVSAQLLPGKSQIPRHHLQIFGGAARATEEPPVVTAFPSSLPWKSIKRHF